MNSVRLYTECEEDLILNLGIARADCGTFDSEFERQQAELARSFEEQNGLSYDDLDDPDPYLAQYDPS